MYTKNPETSTDYATRVGKELQFRNNIIGLIFFMYLHVPVFTQTYWNINERRLTLDSRSLWINGSGRKGFHGAFSARIASWDVGGLYQCLPALRKGACPQCPLRSPG